MSPARTTYEGGVAELLRLAWPFILSNSFWTLQLLFDRVLLSRYGTDEVGAAMASGIGALAAISASNASIPSGTAPSSA